MYNEDKMRKSALGFTLIELLVVITIMTLIGVFTLANYRSFGEDQNLKNAALDIQSLLRTAQINATTGLKCQNQTAIGWRVVFTNSAQLDLACQNSSGVSSSLKPLTFPANISITSLESGVDSCSLDGTKFAAFAPLYGTMTSNCGTSNSITITLTNSKTNNTKQVIAKPGGRIYVQ